MTDTELAELLEIDPLRAFGLPAGAGAPVIHDVCLDLCKEHPGLRPELTRARDELIHGPQTNASAVRVAQRLAGQIRNCWGPYGLDLVPRREIVADVRRVLLDRPGCNSEQVMAELAARYQRRHDVLHEAELTEENLADRSVTLHYRQDRDGATRETDLIFELEPRCRTGWLLAADSPFGGDRLLVSVRIPNQVPLLLTGPREMSLWLTIWWLVCGFLGFLCMLFVLTHWENLLGDLGWGSSIWTIVVLPEAILCGLATSALRRRLGRAAAFGAGLAGSTALVFAAVVGTALLSGRGDLGLWSLPVVGLLIWAAPRMFRSFGGPSSLLHRAVVGLAVLLPGARAMGGTILATLAAAFWVWVMAWAAWFSRGWILPADVYAVAGMAAVALVAIGLPRPWTTAIALGGPAYLGLYWYDPTLQLGGEDTASIWSRLIATALALLIVFSVGPSIMSLVYRIRGRKLVTRSTAIASETAVVWVLLVFPVIWALSAYSPRRMPDAALVVGLILGRLWYETFLGAIRREFSQAWRVSTAHLIGAVAFGVGVTAVLLATPVLGTPVTECDPQKLRSLLWGAMVVIISLKGLALPVVEAQMSSGKAHPLKMTKLFLHAADLPAAVGLLVWCFAPGAAVGTFVIAWGVTTGLAALFHDW